MKKIIKLGLVAVMLFIITGCSDGTKYQEREYTETVKQQSLDSVGLPNVSNFFEMAQLKEIYEMRDNPELILHWYTRNEYTGKWIYEGLCVGYGIPYGASITNPEMYSSTGPIPQAEPNGLYTNTVTSSATWVLATDSNGEIQPQYVESEIRVTPFKIDKSLVEDFSITEDY